MLELIAFTALAGTAGLLSAPLLRGRALPGWLARARDRGRPGVPVTAWLAALLLMGLTWLIGERRGPFGVLLLLIWVGAPLAATRISLLWLHRQRR